jgi:hypothetical protein
MAREILRGLHRVPLAKRHKKIAVGRERKPRTEMKSAAPPRLHAENHRHVFKLALVPFAREARMRDGGPVHDAARLGEGEINPPALFEVGRKHDIEQSALRNLATFVFLYTPLRRYLLQLFSMQSIPDRNLKNSQKRFEKELKL